jgi:type IV secretory pathway VirB4 component
VISGRISEVERMQQIIAATGPKAEQWLPVFQQGLSVRRAPMSEDSN